MKMLYGIDDKFVYRFSTEDLGVDEEGKGIEDYRHNKTIERVKELQDYYKVGYRRYGINDGDF